MPRKKLIYTNLYPYHVLARCNNREWFSLPMDLVWEIFCAELASRHREQQLRIHAFVLMSNHYHMLCSTSSEHPLGEVMNRLQCAVTRALNRASRRINHSFGGPYTGSLIANLVHYGHVYRYLAQNPLQAKICERVEEYPFLVLGISKSELAPFPIDPVPSSMDALVQALPTDRRLAWLNQRYTHKSQQTLAKALRRSEFRLSVDRTSRRQSKLEDTILEI